MWRLRGLRSSPKFRTRRRNITSSRTCSIRCAPSLKLPDQIRVQDRSADVPRKEWFAWPANIFDQLYFIGTKTAGVWAINTPDGVIVIDTNFHYNGTELMMGMLLFGVDPNNIKYVLITHAHDDRYWGAKGIQEKYPNARIGMSAADWDVVAKDSSPPQFKPRKDLVITDGQKITLGGGSRSHRISLRVIHRGRFPLLSDRLTNKNSVASDNDQHFASIWGGVDIGLGQAGRPILAGRCDDDENIHLLHSGGSWISRGEAGVDVLLSTTLAARQHVRENARLEGAES